MSRYTVSVFQAAGARTGILTDVVIETEQSAGEFFTRVSIQMNQILKASDCHRPLSPFMTTQIREPTHLSMSSIRRVSGGWVIWGTGPRTEGEELRGHGV